MVISIANNKLMDSLDTYKSRNSLVIRDYSFSGCKTEIISHDAFFLERGFFFKILKKI